MGALQDWRHGSRDPLTWLDADRYVWKVFAGAPERWYQDPPTLVAATALAHRLLRSDVHTVNVAGPFSRYLASAGDAAAICAAFDNAEPRRMLSETVDAMLHHLGDRIDVVLDCPSPRTLLADGADVGFDVLDAVADAMLDVIRSMADRPIRGLQITCDRVAGTDEDDIDAWSSLLNAAGHYGWVTAVRLDGVTDPGQAPAPVPGDLLLLPDVLPDDLPEDRRCGGGLPAPVWQEGNDADRLADLAAKRGFRFGEIPEDASPEIVLDRITALGQAER